MNIIFFDGVCNLCNSTVDLVVKLDKKKRMKYASLQSHYAKNLLSLKDLTDLDSIIFFKDGEKYYRSDAVIYILLSLYPRLQILKFLIYIPKPFRDSLYKMIARNRYKIFGKKDICRIPTKEEAALFLE